MVKEATETIAKIRALFIRSIFEGEFTFDEHNQELGDLCDILVENPERDTWIPMLFELIEEFDETVDLTVGSPGPLFHSLEKLDPHYQKYLLESYERKPCNTTHWMVSRHAQSPEENKDFWLKKMQNVVNNPNITATLKNDLGI